MSNLQTVQDIYAAFGRGDIPAILARLAENVEWDYSYANAPSGIPWFQSRYGKAGVVGFFESLEALEITKFMPRGYAEGRDLVVALFDVEATVRQTGKRISDTDQAHVWRLDGAGKVIAFRHCADTLQYLMALKG